MDDEVPDHVSESGRTFSEVSEQDDEYDLFITESGKESIDDYSLNAKTVPHTTKFDKNFKSLSECR